MPSQLEEYRKTAPRSQSDLDILFEVYESSPEYKQKGWTTFVDEFTANEDRPSQVRANLVRPGAKEERQYETVEPAEMSWGERAGHLLNMSSPASLITATSKDIATRIQKEEPVGQHTAGLFQPLLPRGMRRVAAGIHEDVLGGPIDIAEDVIESAGAADYETLGVEKEYKLPKKWKQFKRDALSDSIGFIWGTDILYQHVDEDGIEYYAVEKPEGMLGGLTRTIGSVVTVAGAIKKGLTKGQKVLQKFDKPKRGRPSKADLKRRDPEEVLKRQRRTNVIQNLVAAEVGFQAALEPEEARFAFDLGQWAILNENDSSSRIKKTVATIFEYLDLEDPAELSAMENRLGLLVENLFIVGGVVSLFKIPGLAAKTITGSKLKQTKEAFVTFLQSLRNNPEAKEAFKKTLKKSSETPRALKLTTEIIEDTPKISKLREGKLFDQFPKLEPVIEALYKAKQKMFTSAGMMSPRMFEIIKGAENIEKQFGEYAVDLVARLEGNLKKAAREINKTKKVTDPKAPYKVKEDLELFYKGIKGKRKTTEDLNVLFRGVLEGNRKIKELPKSLQDTAKEIRSQVDALSRILLKSDRISAAAKKEIRAGMGTYLRKTYEIFENPKWTPSQAFKAAAVKEVAIKLRRFQGFRPSEIGEGAKADAKRLAFAKELVNRLVTQRGKLTAQDAKVFDLHVNKMYGTKTAEKRWATRKNMSPVIRQLLGETQDISTTVFRTISEMNEFIVKTNMYDDLYTAGKGKYFFKGREVVSDPRLKVGRLKGEQYHALNGMRTTEQIAKLIENTKIDPNAFTKFWYNVLILKGYGQSAATVLNHITHLRNTIGQSLIMAQNGLNPFGLETKQAFKVIENQFKHSKNRDRALQQVYEKYQGLGLVNQNVRVGEFKALINEGTIKSADVISKESLIGRGFHSGYGVIKKGHRVATKLYTAEDDLFRIAAYHKELQVLQRANRALSTTNRLSTEALEKKAAEIIRNTLPTYDLVPTAAKALRKLPIGNFFAFTAERFRNTYHTLARGVEEIGSSSAVIRERGYQRLGAKLAYTYASYHGITEGTKMMYGVTDEMHRGIKNLMLPAWSKDSGIAYYRDDTGRLMYMDVSYTDPDSPVMDFVRTIVNELVDPNEPQESKLENIGDAIGKGVLKFLDPFVSEALVTEAIITSIIRNGVDSETSRRIKGWKVEEEWTSASNIEASLKHLFGTLLPGTLKQVLPEDYGGKKGSVGEHFLRELQGKPPYKRYSKEVNTDLEIFANATGFRFYSLSDEQIQRSFEYKVKEYKRNRNTMQRRIADNISDNVPVEKVLESYREANADFFPYYVNAKNAVQGAIELGVPWQTIKDELWSIPNTTREERSLLIGGNEYYVPLNIAVGQFENIMKYNDFSSMSFSMFKLKYIQLREQLMSLPLVDILKDRDHATYDMLTDEYTDQEIDYELLQRGAGRERRKRAIGGEISEDYPVTDVAKNPADRKLNNLPLSFNEVAADKENPYPTYEDEMKRLGFESGGGVVDENLLEQEESILLALAEEDYRLNEQLKKLHDE